MEKIDKLISDYYSGIISQGEMDDLCRMFLDKEDVRMSYPDESRVLVPLALARMAHRRKRKRNQTWSIAASIAVMLMLGGGIYAHAANTPHTYCNDPSFTSTYVEQWYNKTLETAV